MCQELAELGMAMAHALARKTLAQMAEPEAEPTPSRSQPDPALSFARLSAAVRQAITLEARIAAGPERPVNTRRRHHPAHRPDPPPDPAPIEPPEAEPSIGLDAPNPYPSLLQTLYQDLSRAEAEPDTPTPQAWIPPRNPQSTGPPV